jgi:hypothetical protein
MSTKQKNWAAIGVMFVGLFCLSLVGGLWAQQQYSGGQSVTVAGSLPAGSNTIGAVNIAASQSITATQATGSNLHVAVDSAPTTAVTLATAPALVASTALIGETYPYTGCGTTKVESGSPAGFAALSASTVTLESSTTCVLTFIVSNTGSASFTYYVTDNASTPIPVIGSSGNPVTILPGERDEYTFQNGSKFNAGIKLTASATTGSYYLLGIQ